jgi:small ligand-binding sensory domain FIST
MAEAALAPPPGGFKGAHAEAEDWAGVAKALMTALDPLPPGSNLGFLYVTDPLAADLSSLLTFLRERSGIEHWVGTVGIGIAASGLETFGVPAAVVLVGALPAGSFRVFGPSNGGLAAASELRNGWPSGAGPVFGVVHADPRSARLVETIAETAQASGAFLVGGLSSSSGELPQLADRVVSQVGGAIGLSGVLFDPTLQVATGLTQGCTPLGPVRRVTAAEGNLVIEIDGSPAVEILKQDVGELLARDLRRAAGYVHVGFPISGSDTGDYLVRNLVAIDPERGVLGVAERPQVGQPLLFVRRDPAAARADLERMVRETLARAGSPPRAALYHTCLARGPSLFGPGAVELSILREALGSVPVAGFFANGEISHDRLYTYTGVLTLIL